MMVVVMLFLVASIAMMLNHDSAMNANTSTGELEAARADYVADAAMQHALWRSANNACMSDIVITATTLGSDSYTANVTGAAAATFHKLTADQDAWIRSDDVTKNNGTTADQHIRYESGNIEQALTRFDLSALPVAAQINSATAWFYVSPRGPGGGAHPEGPLTVHRVTADWTETGATWETMNGNFESAALATISAQSEDDVWVAVNLTAQVQAWVNGQPNFGVLMASNAEGVHAQYSSTEASGSEQPYIEVVVGTGPASPVSIQATGTLADGVTRTLSRPVTTAYQPPVAHVFRPDAAQSADAEIYEQGPNNNYADGIDFWVSTASNDTTRSLLRFNIGALPVGARIVGATLFLHRKSGLGADQPVSAHRILNAWSEGSVTWNSRESGTNWDTAGGDFDNTALTTTPVGPVNQRYEWNITPLVQGWVDGSYPNYGVIMIGAIPGMLGERFYTSDEATVDLRPSLNVTFACECGSACMAPQSSGKVLMPASSSSNPTPEEELRIEMLESWGYVVDPYWQKNSQSNYNSKMANYDVVFVPSTANAGDIGTKLTNATIGVVTEKMLLLDELGIAGGNNVLVGSTLEIVDTSHYITRVFPSGTLPMYSGEMFLHTVTSPAPGAQILAEHNSAGAVVVLDVGAALGGGASGNAPGRRVMLPFTATDNFDHAFVNNSGWLLVQRAIAWAMNADFVSNGNLLMVVGDDSNLTTQETAKKTLIESWGYAVNVIDEDDSQGAFDTALAANDVVFVTEDANASDVNTKLTGATIGVVTEEANLSDELGFSAGIQWESGTTLNIDDNTQYITSPFALGALAVLSSSESLARLDQDTSPDLQQLASISSEPMLVTLNAGSSTYAGGVAAGRRAMLPWGGNDMDVNHLNADGLTIFRRALEWGAGAGCGSSTPLLFVVSDADSPTSQEAARRTLIESWCYAVTLISDDAASVKYATEMALNDVMYISQEVTSLTIFSKLRDAPIGIVNEEYLISSALGFGAGTGSGFSNDINIVDNTHYITSGFGLGALALFDPSYDIYTGTGFTLAPDLQVLGEVGSITGLMALETGGRLWDSGNAPARRVQVPWGDDFSALNTDGQTIMQRAIEWAAAVASTNRLLFVVTDADSPAADEIERETLLESWGYIVTRISDEDSQANFDAAASVNDLAYISGDALYDNVGIKLKAATIGVAFESYQLQDEFGLSPGSVALANQQSITIIDSSHYITSPYSGSVQVATSNTQLSSVSSYAPETQMQLLASIPGYNGAIATFDTGDVDHYGETVAGRRVKLPWGSTQWGFDFSTLSADGQDILKRSLEWVAGAEGDGGGGGGGGGGGSSAYIEKYQEWNAISDNEWQTVNLSSYGVPADAVVEIAVINESTSRERRGGVRAVGSSLDRRFMLHEAEGGGVDTVVMHVQADGSGRIQNYANESADISFVLLGYWTGATYVERFDTFSAGGSNSWLDHDFSAHGVGPNEVAEVVLVNTSTSSERVAGVRPSGASFQRRFTIHEAESGGIDTVSLMVETDASAFAQVYAASNSDIDFYVVGYWSTPPGTYVESGGVSGTAVATGTWHGANPGLWGVPPNSVLQMAVSNESGNAEWQVGMRATGSSQNRRIDLQEAESGGADLAVFHVNIDASTAFQIFTEGGQSTVRFYPLGWWVLN